MESFLKSILILTLVSSALAASVSVQVGSPANQIRADVSQQQVEATDNDGVKEPGPDVSPVAVASVDGQTISAGGNIVNFKRFGQDIGINLLDGLITVTVNRGIANRNIAVRLGNQQINVG